MKATYLIQNAGVAVALALAATACRKSGPPQGGMPSAAVTVSQPAEREVFEWDEYSGRLDAVDSVELRARVSGYLQSVNFKDGAEVKKGDLLFVIDPRPFQADLDRAQADLAQAQSRLDLASNEFARAQRLIESKTISIEEADTRVKNKNEANAALQSARAGVETAKLNLEYTHITAPIDGRTSRRLMTEGNLINSTQSPVLTTIVSLDPIYCYFDADERSILKYQQLAREGKRENIRDGKVICELELANETGYPHKGTLDFVDNRVDPGTGTLKVRAIFPNPDRILQPGFFARVRVPGTGKYNALLIPDLAIGTDQDKKSVLVVNEKNVAEYRIVTLGPMIDGLRVVREGIKPKEWVIVNGLMMVRPGAPVTATRVPLAVAQSTNPATAGQ
jgi:RND family efflux transporter MFP subunit